jgi:ribose transport system permease protein
MHENLAGIVKLIGISIILVALWIVMVQWAPDSFLDSGNIENLLRRTALFSILGIGVAFVIMTSGIDLSLGALVCLTGCFLALFLKVDYQPYQQAIVYEVNRDQATMVVDPGSVQVTPGEASGAGAVAAPAEDGAEPLTGQLAAGQWVRLYQTKRTRSGMFQITKVEPMSGSNRVRLTVTPPPSRNESLEDGASIALLAPALPIMDYQTGEQNGLWVSATTPSVPELQARDRVWLSNAEGRLKEQVVVSTQSEDGRNLINVDLDGELNPQEWYWVGLQRRQRMSVPVALLSVLAIGLGLGALHGILVTYVRLQPFVVTLCGLLIYRGWARWLSDDQSVGFGNEYTDSLSWFSLGRLPISIPGTSPDWSLNVPYAFFVLVIIALLAMFLLNWTIWGRYMLALGRNEEAARFSGINTGGMKRLAYIICGGLAGICGILFAIESGSISPSNAGSYFELYAIAAAVLGGCSLRGGEGSISGVIIGTALMQTLNNMITLLKIPNTIELVVLGGVILLGVVVDELIRWFIRLLSRRSGS